VDRERETRILADLVAAAAAGHGSLAIVEGPAGIGKSRLLDEVEELAVAASPPDALLVLRAGGDELRRNRALGLARDLLATQRPEPPAPAAGEAADGGASAIQALVDRLIALGSLPGRHALVLLDDVHWADGGSLRVIEELSAALPRLAMLVVLATRPDEPEAPQEQLDRLRLRAGPAVLRAAPLSADGVARLASAALPAGAVTPPVLRSIVDRSAGNPFLVHELLRLIAEHDDVAIADDGVPTTVRHAVRAQLLRLPPAATELLQAAAILGGGTSLRTAAALAGLGAEEAEEIADRLAATSLLRPGEPVRFVHALIADAVEAELSAFARARLHRRAASLLDEHGAPLETVAAHLLRARPEGDRWVAETLLAAANATNADGDPGAAARLLERARQEPPPHDLRGEVAGALAEAAALAGDPEATDLLREALALIDRPERRAELLYTLSRAFHLAQRFEAAADAAHAALESVEPGSSLYDRALAGWISDGLFIPELSPEGRPPMELIRRELARGHRAAPPLVAHAANFAAIEGQPAEAVLALARRALADDPLVDASAHGFPLAQLSTALTEADLLGDLAVVMTRAVEDAQARSNVLAESTARGGRAYAHRLRGAAAAAIADASRALEIARATGTPHAAWWLLVLVEAHLDRGDPAAADQALRELAPVALPAFARARVLEAGAATALAAGEPDRALALAQESLRDRDEVGSIRQDLGTREGEATLALAVAALGRDDDARRAADAVVGRAAGRGARRRGAALALAGAVRGPDGVDHLREAVDLLRTSPARILLLEALLRLGAAERAAGAAERSREALRQALDLADRLELPDRAAEARALLRTVGARPRRAAVRGVAALTPAEVRVAELAADGLSNPEIGQRLHISRKTVETHLVGIFRKLAIGSRDEIAQHLRPDR